MSPAFAAFVAWLDAVGASLLHFLWQGVLIGIVYALLRLLCDSMIMRYRLGMVALLVAFACPLVTLNWMHVSGDIVYPASRNDIADVTHAAPRGTDLVFAPVDGRSMSTGAFRGSVMFAQVKPFMPWLVALWSCGVCILAIRSLRHWRHLGGIVRDATCAPPEWQLSLQRLRERFAIARRVRLLVSLRVATPMLIGWLRPVILLPVSIASGFMPQQIELIIAHELAHVRRFDYLANLIQVAIETLLFYHPVVCWISRDVRHARESCCDDLVLSLGGDALAYARTLADLEELHDDFGTPSPVLTATGGELFARIQRLVEPRANAIESVGRDEGVLLPLLIALVGLGYTLLRSHALPISFANVAGYLASRSTLAMSQRAPSAVAWQSRYEGLPERAVASSRPQIAAWTASSVSRTAEITRSARGDELVSSSATFATLASATIRFATVHPRWDIEMATSRIPAEVRDVVSAPDVEVARETARREAPLEADVVVPARYPVSALRRGITGKVDLDFRIGADGGVRDVRIVHSTGDGAFDEVALTALRHWHFKPNGVVDLTRRYMRTFAFAHEQSARESCREITGSHICRPQRPDTMEN